MEDRKRERFLGENERRNMEVPI
jgi:hypothetical protein